MTVFMSINAAEGNIGDIYIRRAAMRQLAKHQTDGCIFSGRMSPSYIAAMDIPRHWAVTPRGTSFILRLLKDGVRGDAVVVMAPGPAPIDNAPRTLLKQLSLLVLFASLRALGSQIVVLGRATRGSSRLGDLLEAFLCNISSVYITRDDVSNARVGHKGIRAPDFAFFDPPSSIESWKHFGNRPNACISLRWDRTVCPQALETLLANISRLNLRPLFVVQVIDDDVALTALADRFGVDIVRWPIGRSHAEQERILMDAYSNAAMTVSDRLHVLILGSMMGAQPNIVEAEAEAKLHATLDGLVDTQSIILYKSDEPVRTLDATRAQFDQLVVDMSGVRAACSFIERNQLRKVKKQTRTISEVES